MKSKTPALAALAVFASTVPTFAAEVTYSYYTATGQADTSWVDVADYDSIVAGNVGGATTNFGSVNWLGMTAGNVQTTANGININYSAPGRAWAATVSTFYSGGPSLLHDGGFSGTLQSSGVDFTVTLSGLTIGEDYKVQFVMADNRANTGHATILAKGANVTGDSTTYRYSYTDGQFAVITASFTADAQTVSFQPGQNWANAAPNATFLSAIQVLAYDPPSTTLNWDNGAGNFVWSTGAANWSGSPWDNVILKSAVFGATGAGSITLGEPITAKNLTFDAAGYSITGSTLTLDAPLVTTNEAASIGSSIDGIGGLTKEGTATLTLSGTNLFTGPTTVNAGTLALGHNLALQNSSFNTGSAGTLDLAAVNTPTLGGLSGGTDVALPSNVTSLTLNPQAGGVSYTGNLSGGAAGLTLVKSGAGSQTLSGTSSHSGGTTLAEGVLVVGNSSALGSGAITLDGGTLSTANSPALANSIVINNSGSVIDTPFGSNLFLNGNLTGAGSVTKSGPFSLIMSGDNSGFNGTFSHNASNVFLTGPSSGSASAAWVIGGANLRTSIPNTDPTISFGSLGGSGSLSNSGSNSTVTYSIGALGTDTTFSGTIQDAVSGTNNFVAITKTGSGTLTLSGNNSYTGDTSVIEGTFSLANAYLADDSTVTVANGAVLNLTHGATDIVGTLVLGSNTYTSGTFSAATHGTFISGSGTIQVGADPFLAWISEPNWPGLADRSADGDSDNDNIPNLLEFVLQGGDPLASDTAILPSSVTTATDLVFTYYRRAAATGVTQTFQYSPDLGLTPWVGLAIPGGAGVLVTDEGGGIDKVEITVPRGLQSKLFGRLLVTQP
jgi:autotransporter-associated beta strand protein